MKTIINIKPFKGFTLVELIIVITILAILGTIAYISFQGYTKDARDSSRMSDIKQLYNGISIYKTQTEKTPMPDSYVNILSGTTTISYQGYAGANVLRTLKITGGKDPGTKDYYIYSTDVNQKKGQLMTFMETADKDVQLLGRLKDLKLIAQAQAVTNTGYYQDKKIYVYGDKIGILTDSNKVPLQEITTSTGVNLLTTTTPVTTYFGGSVYSGGLSTSTGLTLINQINGAINNSTNNKYSISGTITNGSGGIINLCGTNTSIDASGNFMLSNIVYGTNCSSIIVTRSGYSCSITTDGPISLVNNISNIAGSCVKIPKIYVTNNSDNNISVINALTNTVITTISVGNGPVGVAVNSTTNTIYVGNNTDSTISVIDGNSNTVISTIPIGINPRGIAVNPITNTIYAVNYNNPGKLVVINGTTNTVTTTITVGNGPWGVAVNPITNTIYTANYNSTNVSVVNGATNTVTTSVGVSNTPTGIAVNPVTNTIYVANHGGTTMSVINGTNNTVTANIGVGYTYLVGVAVNSITNKVYMTVRNSGILSVIDGSNNTFTTNINISTFTPEIAVNFDQNLIYVVNTLANNISVVKGSDNTINTTINVGGSPSGVAYMY